MADTNFLEQCRRVLADRWEAVNKDEGIASVSEELLTAVQACVNSKTKTFRYVLPTQLVSKVADPSIDARSVQAAWGKPGSFDARSVAHEVIVPFDREQHNVLGGVTVHTSNEVG